MNIEPLPVLFYHVGRKEYYRGIIFEANFKNSTYSIQYRDEKCESQITSAKYNNCVICDMSFHAKVCNDKIPT